MPRIAIGDVELNHDRFGTGQPVLLICGTGQASSTKQLFQVPALVAEGYKAVTFDNRGIPLSDCRRAVAVRETGRGEPAPGGVLRHALTRGDPSVT
jgi:hypothetical protein